MNDKKQITILGGGNGASASIRAMKAYLDEYAISAIIAMTDSGSSSGKLRQEFGVLPPGDILRAILSMSRYDYTLLKNIFYDSRYTKHGMLKGFGLGHLFLAFVEKYDGSIINAIRPLAQALDVVGPVFPVTLDMSDLCVALTDGSTVCGEHDIDRPTWTRDLTIDRAWLSEHPQVYPRAAEEIHQSDVIIIGPGSLYTSLIATLLPEGMQEAIAVSSAKLVLVQGHAIEATGETGPEQLSDVIRTIERYLPRPLDVVIYSTGSETAILKEIYAQKEWVPLTDDLRDTSFSTIIRAPFEGPIGGSDPDLLGPILHTWIQDNV